MVCACECLCLNFVISVAPAQQRTCSQLSQYLPNTANIEPIDTIYDGPYSVCVCGGRWSARRLVCLNEAYSLVHFQDL